MRQIHVDVGRGAREIERERERKIEGEKLALGRSGRGGGDERDREEKTGAGGGRGGEEGRVMYGVYLFADTDKHEQNTNTPIQSRDRARVFL